MADVTSLTPPSPGLSATITKQKKKKKKKKPAVPKDQKM